MRTTLVLALGVAAALSAAHAAVAATATVEYVKPEKFTDAGRRHANIDRDETLENLKRHLVERAAKLLPADETLAITVTDVDLAGAFEPWQAYSRELRIVKDIYPPKIDLSYRLTRADGAVVKEGTRTLRDTGFLTTPGLSYSGDNLRYEKIMLDDWMEKDFKDQLVAPKK
ncbi:MAG TPA: DUF3016 domain-containing protein [Usitatibacter sp.]